MSSWHCKATYFYCFKLGCHKMICDKHVSKKWFMNNKHHHRPKVCPKCETKVSCASVFLVSLLPLGAIAIIVVILLIIFVNS